MKRQEIIKEIRRLEKKQLKSMKSMYQHAYIKGGVSLSMLKLTDAWNKMAMQYSLDTSKGFTTRKKNINKWKIKELLDYLDELQDIELTENATATQMNKFINEQTSRWKKIKIGSGAGLPELPEEIDWEKWLKLYELPSEYVASATWSSGAEKVKTIIPLLGIQEAVNPRQTELELASKNVFTSADWDKVTKNARIVKTSEFKARWGL